jgi:hypothetical protein
VQDKLLILLSDVENEGLTFFKKKSGVKSITPPFVLNYVPIPVYTGWPI